MRNYPIGLVARPQTRPLGFAARRATIAAWRTSLPDANAAMRSESPGPWGLSHHAGKCHVWRSCLLPVVWCVASSSMRACYPNETVPILGLANRAYKTAVRRQYTDRSRAASRGNARRACYVAIADSRACSHRLGIVSECLASTKRSSGKDGYLRVARRGWRLVRVIPWPFGRAAETR